MAKKKKPSPEEHVSLAGKLLVAPTSMRDPNFARTIVLLVQHTAEGAMGLVLNRPLEVTLGQALSADVATPREPETKLHQGGPCEGPLMVLHGYPEAAQMDVLPDVHFSAEEQHVRWLLEHNERPIRYFVGYAGWSAGQLEGEIEARGWAVMNATATLVFEERDAWERIGLEIALGYKLRPSLIPPDARAN